MTKTWSSRRRRPSGKRRPVRSRNARRTILCGVRLSISGAFSTVAYGRFLRNSSTGTPRPLPAILPTTTSASCATP